MAFRKAYGRRRSTSAVRGAGRSRDTYRARAPKRAVRGRASRAAAPRRAPARRSAPARQTVRVEIVYRDPQTLARPQGTETMAKGTKPKL